MRDTTSLLRAVRVGAGPGAVLARGSASAFVLRSLGLVVVFGNQVLLARVLGAGSYGEYVYAIAWLSVLVLLATGGPGGTAVRFVAQYVGQEDWGGLRGFIRRAFQWVLATAGILAVGMAATAWTLSSHLSEDLLWAFCVGSLLLPFWAVLEVSSATLRGFGRIAAAQFPLEVARPVLFALAIGGLWMAGRAPLGAPLALTANLVVTTGCAGYMLWSVRDALRNHPKAQPIYRVAEWVRVGGPLLFMGAFGLVLSSTDTIMLGALRSTTEAGVYSVASRGAGLVSLMLAAANLIAAPLISKYHATGQEKRLKRLLGMTAWLAMVVAIPAACVLIVAGRFLLAVFGADFVSGYQPMVILVAAQVVNVACGAVVYLVAMSGHQLQAMVIVGGSAGVNVLLNAALIPALGSVGAAVASATSMVLWNLALVGYSLHTMKLNPTVLQRWWR